MTIAEISNRPRTLASLAPLDNKGRTQNYLWRVDGTAEKKAQCQQCSEDVTENTSA